MDKKRVENNEALRTQSKFEIQEMLRGSAAAMICCQNKECQAKVLNKACTAPGLLLDLRGTETRPAEAGRETQPQIPKQDTVSVNIGL